MKKYLLLFCFFISLGSSAQQQNGYKYATVPYSFDFLSEPNQYNLNELAKFLTSKKGVVTFFDSETKSVAFNSADPCNILRVNVSKEKAFLAIKLKISLIDCNGNIIAESVGSSKEKDFRVAYNYALREAFDSLLIPFEKQKQQEEISTNNSSDVLYAKKTSLGYKVYDNKNIEKYTLYTTSKNNVFIVSDNQTSGILYKNENSWTIEYLKNGVLLKVSDLKIQF